jgi:hypothetical protein
MDARAALITEISRLSGRERELIAHSRGGERTMQAEPDKTPRLASRKNTRATYATYLGDRTLAGAE